MPLDDLPKARLTPPAVTPPERPLPYFHALWKLLDNPIEAWSRAIYEEPFVERGVAVISLAKRIEEVFLPGQEEGRRGDERDEQSRGTQEQGCTEPRPGGSEQAGRHKEFSGDKSGVATWFVCGALARLSAKEWQKRCNNCAVARAFWAIWVGRVERPASFAYLAAVSMFLGFFAWYRGLAIGPVARVSQVQLVQPVLTLAWAALLLGEELTPALLLGGLVVILCAALAVRVRLGRIR